MSGWLITPGRLRPLIATISLIVGMIFYIYSARAYYLRCRNQQAPVTNTEGPNTAAERLTCCERSLSIDNTTHYFCNRSLVRHKICTTRDIPTPSVRQKFKYTHF